MRALLRKIYKALPFKKQLFSLIRPFSPGNSLYQHLHFTGVFNTKVKGKNLKLMHYGYQVENTLFWKGVEGCWEKRSVGLWMKLCERADVIMDIGANTGVYALIAKTLKPDADVHAFEPMPKIYERMVHNGKLNSMNIHFVQKALSNFDGTAKVYPVSDDHIYSVTVNKNLNANDVKVFETEIPVQTFKSYIEQAGITKIDVMKIDVEMHEYEMLSGMGEYLQKFKPDMIIEILSDEIGTKVESLISNLDYLYFNINEDGDIKKVDSLTKSDYYNFLVCSPGTAKYLQLV